MYTTKTVSERILVLLPAYTAETTLILEIFHCDNHIITAGVGAVNT